MSKELSQSNIWTQDSMLNKSIVDFFNILIIDKSMNIHKY